MYRMFDFFFFIFYCQLAFVFLNVYSRSNHYVKQSFNGIYVSAYTVSPVRVAVLEEKTKRDCVKMVPSPQKHTSLSRLLSDNDLFSVNLNLKPVTNFNTLSHCLHHKTVHVSNPLKLFFIYSHPDFGTVQIGNLIICFLL